MGYMSQPQTQSRQRVNVMLPWETLRVLEKIAPRGDRSRVIDDAVRFYVQEAGRFNLRKRLREGAARRAERDLQLAQEWFPVEDAVWHRKGKK